MADILKISTTLVDKVPVQPNRPVADPAVPFSLSDISKVIQTDAQSPMQQQSNTLIDKETAPSILMDMLRDPAITASFLKNVFMLEEIINLIPLNNTALTQEIQQIYSNLLVSPEKIVEELTRQENTSTAFRGELFDILRTMLRENKGPEMRFAITNLLKSFNGEKTREPILHSIANNLEFVAKSVSANFTLSEKLTQLAVALRTPSAPAAFVPLKDEIIAAIREVESSILFTPKLQKIIPLIIYNLSRFQDNPDFLKEAAGALISTIVGDDKREALLLTINRELNLPQFMRPESSRVMDVIAKIVELGVKDEQLSALVGDKFEKIIHSLLSSPCNYTPLLHFIVPVETPDLRAFAELWIDPANVEDNTDDTKEPAKNRSSDPRDSIHVLAVFDVDSVGRFEAELFTYGKELTLSLMCPEVFVAAFTDIGERISAAVSAAGYTLTQTRVEQLVRQRSLMDVFKDLPKRRTGIDVKI